MLISISYEYDIRIIEELLEKYDVDCLTFLFGGDMNVFWDRYLQREAERHCTHKFVGQNKERFINGGIKAGFGDFAIGRTIRVDATDFGKIDYDELFTIASQFITSFTNEHLVLESTYIYARKT